MVIIRNIALAVLAAGALALGSAAIAQETSKPEAKPDAHKQGEHRGHGMHRMREMRGGCHGDAQSKHDHS